MGAFTQVQPQGPMPPFYYPEEERESTFKIDYNRHDYWYRT